MYLPPDAKKAIPIIRYLKALKACLVLEGSIHLIKLNHFITPVEAYP